MRYIWSIAGILISAVCVYFFWRYLPEDLLRQIASHGVVFLVGSAILIPAYLCRATKSWILLQAPGIGKGQIAGSLYASIALNNVLPFRMGDVLRLFYLRAVLSIALPKTASALLLERVTDLALILLLFGITALFVGGSGLNFYVAVLTTIPQWLIIVGLVFAVAGLALAFAFRKMAFTLYRSTIGTLGLKPPRIAAFLLVALAQWVLEIIILGWTLSVLVANVPGVEGVLSSFMSNLSTLVPSAPGYVGTFEIAGIFPFQFLLGQVTPDQALFVVLYHLVIWTFSTGLGLLASAILIYADRKSLYSARQKLHG
jgi:uncharacterized membrane protein YbhN (UPF0104 family)